jgi:hypothetical protein
LKSCNRFPNDNYAISFLRINILLGRVAALQYAVCSASLKQTNLRSVFCTPVVLLEKGLKFGKLKADILSLRIRHPGNRYKKADFRKNIIAPVLSGPNRPVKEGV